MPRDYAKQRPTGRKKKAVARKSTPGWIYLLTGLLIGLFIAGLAYVKENTLGSLYSSLKPQKASTRMQATSHKNQTVAALPTPRFDFYTILPKMSISVPPQNTANNNTKDKSIPIAVAQQTTSATTSVTTAATAAPTPPPPTKTAPATNQIYLVQVASFEKYTDADKLKAQLLLDGFTAQVKTSSEDGKTINRILLGPYHSSAEAHKVLAELESQKLSGILIAK